jgi:GH24 family phage-related lysozyme (muramidase)
MDLSPAGAAFVRYEEGFVSHFYRDAVGVGTIGVGFTWGSAAFRQWWAANKPEMAFGPGATMTRDEAEKCLIYLFTNEYGRAVGTFLGHDVPQNVFDGMGSPVYNLGPGSLQWRWAALAKAGDYAGCAAALRITGTTAKGRTLSGLVRRRKEEAALIESGVYAGVGTAPAPTTSDPMSDGMLTRGERGPAVASLIADLAELGYYKGNLDDIFGYGTEAAVLAFQRDHGLTPDGVANADTLKAINLLLVPKPAAPAPTAPVPAPATPPKTPAAPVAPVPPKKPVAKHVGLGVGALAIGAALARWWGDIANWFHVHHWF